MNGQVSEVTKCPSPLCPLFIFRNGGCEKIKTTRSDKKIDDIETGFEKDYKKTVRYQYVFV